MSWFFIFLSLFVASASTLSFFELQDVNRIARLNNRLAVDIHRKLSAEDANVLFSPLSISTALAMLFYGTRGKTAEEMRRVLGYRDEGFTDSKIHSAFRSLMEMYDENSASGDYLLYVANAVLVQTGYPFFAEYKNGLREIYKAAAAEVDFENESEKAVQEINNWVKEKTKRNIYKLLETIDSSTAMVLLNAVYFKGTWHIKFDPKRTRERAFFNEGFQTAPVMVPMMNLLAELPYARLRGAAVLELPYKTEDISMVILLPDEMDGLAGLERELNSNTFNNIKTLTRKTKVHVTFPKFKLECKKSLKSTLQQLGIKSVFEDSADLSGMSKAGPLAVSEVIHKAAVEVNEEGSEASASTGVIIENRSMGSSYTQFLVNHPFVFAIIDRRSNLILFQGRVSKL